MTSDDGHGVPQSLGGHQKGSFFGRRSHSINSINSAARQKVAATNQAFADPLVATTAAFVRADAGEFHD
jgi:hypothetical protein